MLIEGLKHKIMVYLLKKKQQEAAGGNHEAMKQFQYVYDHYVNLLIWKVTTALHMFITHATPENHINLLIRTVCTALLNHADSTLQ